jgi:zinc protease
MNGKKIFYLMVCFLLLSKNVSANYIENIKKCDFDDKFCVFYERKDSEIIDLTIILRHSGDVYEEKKGLNAFALSMINMGSKDYSHRDFQNKLKELSATFNVYSDRDHSYIYLKSLKENFLQSIELIFQAFFNTNFSDENFQIVKNSIISQIRENSQNYEYLSYQAFLKEIFKDQIYQEKILNENDINNIKIDDVKNYIFNKLHKSFPDIILVGDLNNQYISKNLKKYFIDFRKDDLQKKEIEKSVKINLFSNPIYIKDEIEKAQTIIHFAQKIPNLTDKDFIAMYLVNDYIGGGGLSSKLMKKLREEMNITYSARTTIVNLEKINYMSGSVATGSKDIEVILNEIKNIFKGVVESGINENDLDDLKKKFYGRQAMSFSDNNKSLYDLLFLVKNQLPFDFYEKNKLLVEKITAEDIKNVVKNFIDSENLSFVIFN